MRLRDRQRAARIQDIAEAYCASQSKQGLDGLQRRITQLMRD